MFLPVLLVREFGLWGWIVFAVPNVVGAAAMGWVLKGPAASEKIVARHATACFFFSIVTIAFHLFFLGLLWRMVGPAVFLLALFALACAVGIGRKNGDWIAAGTALAASIAGMIFLWSKGLLAAPPVTLPQGNGTALAALALVCVFGFGLCPYLDLTFHRARQNTAPGIGRAAFTFGFFGPFLLMIVFTLLYSRPLIALVGTSTDAPINPLLAWVVAIHIFVQSAFTIVIHGREVTSSAQTRWGSPALAILLVSIAAAIAVIPPRRIWGLDVAEIGYRLFMGFYGLVFPAYVWLCMIPARKGSAPPSRSMLTVFWLAVVLAAPFYAIGFLGQKMIWLIPGVVVVLAARVWVRVSGEP